MRRHSPIRAVRLLLALGLGLLAASAPVCAQYRRGGGGYHAYSQGRMMQERPQQGMRGTPAPMERSAPARNEAMPESQARSQLAPIERRNPQPAGPRGEHLPQWMNQHSNLTPQQQQQALAREPGFKSLPPQTQQRMRNRLAQLDAMSPVQRQRLIAHTEWMEHLSVPQRAQVRGAMQQLGSLPPDQRRAVARSFRELRELPPDQRFAAMNSGQYGWMNGSQRTTLNNLLRIEPLIPPSGR